MAEMAVGGDDESIFETSHVLGAHLVSSPLLPQAWNQCVLAAAAARVAVQTVDDVVYVAFPGSPAVSAGAEFFSSVPIGSGARGIFSPLAKDVDGGEPVLVHASALQLFLAFFETPEFKMLASEIQNKAVVFTGHSVGGSVASLVSLFFLCSSACSNPPSPASLLCITFGSPLLGNEALSLAVLRERWGDKFCHVVSQYDIMPRLLFCPPSSIAPELTAHLAMQGPQLQSPDEKKEELCQYIAMQIDKATVEQRLFRPFGSYVFCSTEGTACIDNSVVIVRLLYLTFVSGLSDCSIVEEHISYGNLLGGITQKLLAKKQVTVADEIPSSNYDAEIQQAIEALGIGIQDMGAEEAKECLKLSKRMWRNPNLNCANLTIKLAKVTPCRAQIEWYKASCDDEMGYYDTFKQRRASKREFKVNINRIKLAQFWDEVITMLQDNKLPFDFDKRNKWINASQFYMLLVEPLDIADYYKTGMHKRRGHYTSHGRERRYQVFDKWWKEKKKDCVEMKRSKFAGLTQDSCFWAKVEEAKEWIEEARKEKDATRLAQLCENLVCFEYYAKNLVERKEVSIDVLAPRSSYTMWNAEWNSLKLQLGVQMQP